MVAIDEDKGWVGRFQAAACMVCERLYYSSLMYIDSHRYNLCLSI